MGAYVSLVALGGYRKPGLGLGTMTDMDRPPLGIIFIGSSLKQAGYDVELFHLDPEQIEATAQRIAGKHPLFVGFTVYTGLPTKYAAVMSRAIRRQSDVPIVWGGVHPTMVPEDCLREPFVDIVVRGEGEQIAIELANALEKKTPLDEVRGIGFKKNGHVVLTERPELIHDLDAYPVDLDLYNVPRYFVTYQERKRGVHWYTSRGCPHHCGFCYLNAETSMFEEGSWRGNSSEHVLKDMQTLKDVYDVDFLSFVDDNLFVNKKRGYEIVGGLRLPWWGEAVITYTGGEFGKKLAQSDCRTLFFGFESGSDRILKLFNIKNLTTEKILTGVRKMAEYPSVGLKASGIVGQPTETPEEACRTLRLTVKMSDIHPNINFNLGQFLPFPGTPAFKMAVDLGFKPPERTEDWEYIDRSPSVHDRPGESMVYPVWLPWATPQTAVDIDKLVLYANLYSGQVYGPLWREFPPVKFLRLMARRRLKTWDLKYPYDLRMADFLLHYIGSRARPLLTAATGKVPWDGLRRNGHGGTDQFCCSRGGLGPFASDCCSTGARHSAADKGLVVKN